MVPLPKNLFRIKYPDNLPDQIYYAMGLITVNWSFVEQSINNCVKLFFYDCKGKPYAKPKEEIPLSLNSKRIFMRKCLHNVPLLIPFKEQILPITDRIKTLANERHDMIHGIIIEISDNNITFAKYDVKKIYKIHGIEYSITDFHSVGKKMLDLANDLSQFFYDLLHLLHKRQKQH